MAYIEERHGLAGALRALGGMGGHFGALHLTRWLAAGAVAASLFASASPAVLAQAAIPQTEGWVLVVSRCVICHSVEIAVQQRQGPQGWAAIVDRMVSYGMPLEPAERRLLIAYLVRHYGDPQGR